MRNIKGTRQGKLTIGERIELRRRQRGLSRRAVADMVGRSEEWLRLVESGRHRLDSVEVIIRLAEVLHITDFLDLIELPAHQSRPSTHSARALIETLEHVLTEHPADLAANDQWHTTVSIPQLSASIRECRTIWDTSQARYSELSKRLPATLAAGRALRAHNTPGNSAAAAHLLVECYHAARFMLTRLGGHSAALTAADRAVEVAIALDDPILAAAAAWHMASALLHLDRYGASADYATAAAQRLTHDSSATAERVCLFGALHLVAAKSAAYAHDIRRADLLLNQAYDAARTHHGEPWLGIPFSEAEIGLARMEVALVRRDYAEVITLADEFEPTAEQPITTRTRYHIALACAFAGNNDYIAAGLALDKAADACPEELRYDHDAHRALHSLIRHGNGRLRHSLQRLAALAQLA